MVPDLFERFGIDRFGHTKVAALSTGMKQKTSLAVSLVHDPDVILFVDPTNGLDVLMAITVLSNLAYTAFGVAVLQRMFNSERLMFAR